MKGSNFITIVFFIIWFQNPSKAQSTHRDSILKEIRVIKTASAQLNKDFNIEKAIDTLEYAKTLYRKHNLEDEDVLFGLYVDLSNLYGHESIRQPEESEAYIDKAEALIEKADLLKKSNIVNFYISIGANKLDSSFFQESLGYISKANEYYDENFQHILNEVGNIDSKILKLDLLEWYVSVYQKMKLEKDLKMAFRNLELYYLKNQNVDELDYYYALASFRMGRFYQADDAEKAVFYFDKAEAKGDENIQLYSNICKGFAYLSAKEYSNLPQIVAKLNTFENLNRFQQLNIHEIAGRLYSEQKNIEKLVYHSNQALNLLNKNNTEIDVLDFKAEDFSPIEELKYPILLNQFAQFIEAVEDPILKETSTKLFHIGLEQFSDRIDREPFNNQLHNYKIIKNRMLHQISNPDVSLNTKKQILSYFENIENRANHNNLLKNRTIANTASQLDNYIKKEKTIRDKLTELKQKQQDLDTIFRQELSKLEVDLAEINKKIEDENPSFFKLNSSKFSFDNLNLAENTSVLIYSIADGELFRTTLSMDNIRTTLIGNYKSIELQVEEFLIAIKNPNSADRFNELSQNLYNILLSEVSITDNLIIKADESLLNIPFELLQSGSEYVIENSTIAYTKGLFYLNQNMYKSEKVAQSNANFYVPNYQNFMPADTELALRGEPYNLEGAQEEVQTLSELIGGQIYEKEQASKSNFFKTANNSSILHIAGHAFLNNDDAELSYIALSDSEEDNQLFISELYALKSNANLAVLSACNTGVGGYKSGQGIISLSEAFMYSGIPSTVSSLWSAPDQSTKDIMISFYHFLSEGFTKSKALQKAKLEYLSKVENPKLKHPYYWAGFVMYGNDAPIPLKNHTGLDWYYRVLITLGIILIFTLIYKLIKTKKQPIKA